MAVWILATVFLQLPRRQSIIYCGNLEKVSSSPYPSVAMYKALFVNELVANICSYVDKRADLAALARTCSGFREPAIHFLWENLYTLAPLLRTLPRDAYGVDKYGYHECIIFFCSYISIH
ncbi:hypothetical protein C8Q79DRAFT_538646 [Trametes meyenii]|nr:hypothetical protein C8Q79DRAFT_538646 [Trametes meyenii]